MTVENGTPRVVTREDIVAQARSYIGVPWVHQGRSMDGIDCVGHATMTARGLALSTFDLTDYDRVPSGIELLTVLRSQMPEIHPARRFQLGDLCVFSFIGMPTHVGIVGDYKYGGFSLIHAFNEVGKVVEHRFDETLWMRRLTAAFSLIDAKR